MLDVIASRDMKNSTHVLVVDFLGTLNKKGNVVNLSWRYYQFIIQSCHIWNLKWTFFYIKLKYLHHIKTCQKLCTQF